MPELVNFSSLSAGYFAEYLVKLSGNWRFIDFSQLAANRDQLLFLVGLYGRKVDYRKLISKRRTIALLAGADILHLRKKGRNLGPYMMDLFKQRLVLATESPEMRKNIAELLSLDSKVIYLPSQYTFPSVAAPLPEKFAVGCYMPYYAKSYYFHELIFQVIKAMPDVTFHFYSTRGYDPTVEEKAQQNLVTYPERITDMPKFLERISCGLRITYHDTYSMTAIEYNLAGRNFINNHEMPYCIKVGHRPTVDEVIAAVRQAQATVPDPAGFVYYHQRHTPERFRRTIHTIYGI